MSDNMNNRKRVKSLQNEEDHNSNNQLMVNTGDNHALERASPSGIRTPNTWYENLHDLIATHSHDIRTIQIADPPGTEEL